MQTLVLKVIDGPDSGLQFAVRRGQRLRVGKSTWADMQCPNDAALQDVHFELAANSEGWNVTVVQPESILQVNGQNVETSPVNHADRISAGNSVFQIQDANLPEIVDEPEPTNADDTDEPVTQETGPEIPELLAALEITLDSKSDDDTQLQSVVDALLSDGNFSDAVRLVAAKIGAVESVSWQLSTYEQYFGESSPIDTQIADVAQAWIENQTDEGRREAERLVGTFGLDTPQGWIAQSIFWSGGSISAPDLPDALAPPYLFADAVGNAMLLISIDPVVADFDDVPAKITSSGIALEGGLQVSPSPSQD